MTHPDDIDTPENRSEIVFVYDAENANPNGNPLSPTNEPRIDPETSRAIVTDVRLKRYLRDQLQEDGEGVYIQSPQTGPEPGDTRQRFELLLERFEEELTERLHDLAADGDADGDADDGLGTEVYRTFLDQAIDVRYFGATLSIESSSDEQAKKLATAREAADRLPDHFTGPLQFSPAKSLNEVRENENYESLTSVIASSEGAQQGGFDLADNRIQYGIFPFHGVVNEQAAPSTRLREADVERLDTLCWRALKNQTRSRSKKGQQPRLYVRAEYAAEGYHHGDLHHLVSIDRDHSGAGPFESVTDVALDVTGLVSELTSGVESGYVDTIHVKTDDLLTLTYDGVQYTDAQSFYEVLEDETERKAIDVIDVGYGTLES
jgi:CRISPR-associated protein Csh2